MKLKSIAIRGGAVLRVGDVLLLLGLVCWSTACIKWPDSGISATQPDRALLDRAMSAVDNKHFDVAKIVFETLINTYPDSEYASKAQLVLQDPRFSVCTEFSGSIVFGEGVDAQKCGGSPDYLPPDTRGRAWICWGYPR